MAPGKPTPYQVLLAQLGTYRFRARYATPPPTALPTPTPMSLDQFYDQVFFELGLRDPENFTALGLPRAATAVSYNDQLTNGADAYLHATYALERQYLQQLDRYDPAQQTPQQALSTAALRWYLTDSLQGEAFVYLDSPLNPMYGIHITLHDLLTDLQPLTTRQDAQDYIARLNAFPARIAGVLDQMKIREQRGIFMPRWMIDRVIQQLQRMIPPDVGASDFYTTFARKVGSLAGISAADRQALTTEAEHAVATNVYPAYQALIDDLRRIAPQGRATDGVWDLPDGDAYYRYLVQHHTNTTMTPEEVHNLGLREVSRIQSELRQALAALGYGDRSLAAGIQAVIEAGGVYPTDTPAGKQAVLDAFRALIARASTNLGPQFDRVPQTALEVRAVPPEQEAGAPGGYYLQPALDGSRPGVFYANLGGGVYPKYSMPTLAYHEAIPGHHFQLSTQVELQGIPLFQKAPVFPFPTAFVEGWGLYAEQLAAEAGLYQDDPYGNIGRLKAELFRASRLVVDTGIHWKHWSRQQAIDYMDAANGTTGGAYTAEVERYIAWPGQALAYKVGELTILDLRERARTQLGDRFAIKAFHNAVLGSGSLPLPVLEQAVNH